MPVPGSLVMLYARQPAVTAPLNFLRFVEGEAEVARRVTLAAMGERLAHIRTAVPFRAPRGVCMKALVGVEQP